MKRKQHSARRQEFEELANPYLDGMYSLALHLTRNPAAAEDLTQDAYLRAFARFESFTPGTNFRAWILKILRNIAINQFRANRMGRASVELATVAHRLQAPSHGVAAHGSTSYTSHEITKALAKLSEEYRTAIVLACVEGFSYREIASIMNCPIGTVMSRICRARRLLKSDLGPYGSNRRRRAPIARAAS